MQDCDDALARMISHRVLLPSLYELEISLLYVSIDMIDASGKKLKSKRLEKYAVGSVLFLHHRNLLVCDKPIDLKSYNFFSHPSNNKFIDDVTAMYKKKDNQICDEIHAREIAKQEVLRRYFNF